MRRIWTHSEDLLKIGAEAWNQPKLKSYGSDLIKRSALSSMNNLNNIKCSSRISFRALLLTLFLALAVGQFAIYVTMAAEETVTLSSSGVWVSTDGGSGVTGTGTNEVRWGSIVSPYNKKSGMRFDGQSASFTTGQEFCLGQLTHFNWPITNAASGAKLRVSLHFATPSISPDPTFDFDIAIDETENPFFTTCALSSCEYSPCATIPCPDRVSWSNSIPSQTFTIGSETYTLQMVGFKDSCPSGNLVTKLVTQETMDNKAYLVGKIVLTRPAIHLEKKTNGEDADTGTGPTILSGCPVTWTYEVTNAGNVVLTDVSVTDNPAQTITRISGDTNSDNKLDLTETWIYRATGNAQSGQYSNIATVQGKKGSSYVTDTDPSHYFGQTLTLSVPSVIVCAGGTATFAVTPNPSDTGNYNYQWQVNGGSGWSDITGDTNPGISFTTVAADSGKQYRVNVGLKNQATCTVSSAAATLTVRPTIALSGPASATVCAGAIAAFTVTPNPSDTGNYNYQWQVNGGSGWSDITAAVNPGFSFTTAAADSGKQYRVVTGYKTLPGCPATSGTATLTVQGGTSVNAGSDQTICVNENAQLTGTATNYASAVWTIAEGSGTLTQIPIDPGNPAQIKATFTATASPGNLFTTTVAKLTATSTSHCSGEVSDTLTIKVLQIPLVAIHIESPS